MDDIREGETVGDYVSRLERRVKELEPPEGFTIPEWHIGQVYAFLFTSQHDKTQEEIQAWSDFIGKFEVRFPGATKKFSDYMGWNKADK